MLFDRDAQSVIVNIRQQIQLNPHVHRQWDLVAKPKIDHIIEHRSIK